MNWSKGLILSNFYLNWNRKSNHIISMKCLCCFNEEFPLHEINSVDRKSYHQLTNLNSSDLVDQKKICGNCRKRLKEYSSFLVQCRKSYDLIKKSGSAPQKSVKRRSPRKSPAENIKIVVEFSQDAAADSPSLLSPVEMLLDDEITTAESLDKEEHTKKDQQTIVLDTIESKLNVGESFSSKLNRSCSSKIWQCDTCGKEFATKFRLTTHIRKLKFERIHEEYQIISFWLFLQMVYRCAFKGEAL